jgi:uncharacterized OB-fold protein
MTMHEPTHAVAPVPTSDSHEFWAGCDAGRLLLRRCLACERVYYYPRLACPRCSARDQEWIEASGRGHVHSHTTVFTSFYGPDWEGELPYTVLLVDLEEGPRMAPVRVDFRAIDGRSYPFFRLEATPGS